MIKIRKIGIEDKEKIIAISSKIWEGEDYIDSVFDDWISDDKREFVCIADGESIYGFASMKILPDDTVWFEGLRVDPDARGRGYGSKLTEYLIERVKGRGGIIRLSTYFKNYESLHIVSKYGFQKIKGYNFLEKETSPVGINFTEKRIDLSGVDFIPIDWVFYANNTKNLSHIDGKLFCLGDENGNIHVSLSEKKGKDTTMNIFSANFIDPKNLKRYFAMAETFAFKMKQKYICTMLPFDEKFVNIATEYGFSLWEEVNENTVLLEKRF